MFQRLGEKLMDVDGLSWRLPGPGQGSLLLAAVLPTTAAGLG